MTKPTRLSRRSRALLSTAPLALAFSGACASGNPGGESVSSTSDAVNTQQIASIALANVGKGACSVNSAGGKAFATSCTGNGGQPEYWCADFALWVWGQAGVDTSGLTAAAGSFYTYGQTHGTIHGSPSVGDAVVFDYEGGGVADHVAIVTEVNANGTIESVSGDWGGSGSSEAAFSSTSHVDMNVPAYAAVVGSRPAVIGMTISAFVSPAGGGSSGSAGGGTPAPPDTAAGCFSDTLDKEMPANACVQSASDGQWYQCDNGSWVDRWNDPTACDGTYPLPSADTAMTSAKTASGNGSGASGNGSGNGGASSEPPPSSTSTPVPPSSSASDSQDSGGSSSASQDGLGASSSASQDAQDNASSATEDGQGASSSASQDSQDNASSATQDGQGASSSASQDSQDNASSQDSQDSQDAQGAQASSSSSSSASQDATQGEVRRRHGMRRRAAWAKLYELVSRYVER
jgi:hypothetical protein